jgi:predicted enzyme related to lactoylglutathione lyase
VSTVTDVVHALDSKTRPVVHLELHTGDVAAAAALYAELCGWRTERVETACGAYQALAIGEIGGGMVECEAPRPLWLPYVEVPEIGAATERARRLVARGRGARLLAAKALIGER